MNIRLVRQEDLNKQLYNSCVHFATNGSIYGYDWFLNATAREWDVLVEGDDWVSVMPLPRRKNWFGRIYLEQPRLVPELAVYTVRAMSQKRIQAFWDAIPAEYRGGGLTVEPASVPADQGRFEVKTATGTVLLLDQPYEDIIGDFSPTYREGLLRAEDAGLRPTGSFKPETFADLWLKVNGKSADNEWTYHAMLRIMYQVLHRSWGNTQAVADADGNILAAVFIVYSHNRIFPLYKVETTAGKQAGALAYLWDNLLKGHAERSLKIKREEVFSL
ncbi:hypothetical protein [Lewinella sp. 4G2]|uniref:hypothetical protein n=1 Tax=Lewinella sp. 4G2 TaxID=1803372 RepID=UPI0007B4AF69|nr:hypothetical protein [Lewinella sp. 4G2]OAV43923.1 hypothetical protein A3850_005185 [Lewinella sp. 4G2]